MYDPQSEYPTPKKPVQLTQSKKKAFCTHLTHEEEVELLKRQADTINRSPESALGVILHMV